MSYSLFRELINLTEEFEKVHSEPSQRNISSFARWLADKYDNKQKIRDEPDWLGKAAGRSPESVISTLIVHLYRYAKLYSKNALANSPFTSIDEVIFLINLQHLGSMTKIKLIELNIHEKSTGIQIINRLINKNYIAESINTRDKRSKEVAITDLGSEALESVIDNIRNATRTVAGDLDRNDKMQLIKILQKLEAFHLTNSKNLKQLQMKD